MDDRLKSAIATVLIHVALGYVLIVGLTMSIPRHANDKMSLINLTPERAPPPPKNLPPPPKALPPPPAPSIPVPAYSDNLPPEQQDYATLSPVGRLLAVIRTQKWVVGYVKAERARMVAWRLIAPQGTGPAKVTRLRPPNLTTHTVYWPPSWSKGLLPIIAWGSEYEDMCSNNSLPYAGFLGEIASHGYFIVAVGNDDIDYPKTGGPDLLPDGRPVRAPASALRKGIDWAIAENSRAGSPYQGKLDTSKIAYMGHGCGGGQAMAASSDPRTTTTVLLNASARFNPGSSDSYRAPIAHFEGLQDNGGVLSSGDANFARAQAAGWPMFKAALDGMGHDEAYRGPDPRWTKAVLAWLDWQLKGDNSASGMFRECGLCYNPLRKGWSRSEATGL